MIFEAIRPTFIPLISLEVEIMFTNVTDLSKIKIVRSNPDPLRQVPANQLRLVSYPIISKILAPSQVVNSPDFWTINT